MFINSYYFCVLFVLCEIRVLCFSKGVYSDIKKFIDFFHDACLKIRKEKPKFVRGKDGNLVKQALNFFSRQQLEMLAVWFLEKKHKLSPSLGGMLGKEMTKELKETIKKPSFWKDLDKIHEKYYKQNYDPPERK